MQAILEITTEPNDADRDAIGKILGAYNESKVGPVKHGPLAVRIRNSKGEVVGGLMGERYYSWLFVRWLSVPEDLRGQGLGTELMRMAEEFARADGCVGIWLDTFEFQARPFYERLGYSVFGTIENFPPGSQRHFLQKRLD